MDANVNLSLGELGKLGEKSLPFLTAAWYESVSAKIGCFRLNKQLFS